MVTPQEALEVVDTWMHTPMREARYIRRLAKIKALESS
jgi:ribose 5-phosphate isomerase RpiB